MKNKRNLFFPMIANPLQGVLWVKSSPEEMSVDHETGALTNVIIFFQHPFVFCFNRREIGMVANLAV